VTFSPSPTLVVPLLTTRVPGAMPVTIDV
jgi:hypothetical protein